MEVFWGVYLAIWGCSCRTECLWLVNIPRLLNISIRKNPGIWTTRRLQAGLCFRWPMCTVRSVVASEGASPLLTAISRGLIHCCSPHCRFLGQRVGEHLVRMSLSHLWPWLSPWKSFAMDFIHSEKAMGFSYLCQQLHLCVKLDLFPHLLCRNHYVHGVIPDLRL